MTVVPKLLTIPWMKMLPTETKLCCSVLGMAMRVIRSRMEPENSAGFSSQGSCRIRRRTVMTASTQLTPWHRNVAQATPATPIWSPATNQMSMAIFVSDEATRKINGVRESPRAEKIPVEIL